MPASHPHPGPFRTAELSQAVPTAFEVAPDADTCAALAETLGITRVRKLRFAGEIRPVGKRGFELRAELGATVVQPCVVTLDPVTTRIDTEVVRTFLPPAILGEPEPGSEVEMPEDDTTEPLPDVIDPAAVMAEALALALPDYPRADGAHLGQAEARPEGAEPIRPEETKPFSGLAALRDRMADGDGEAD
ncbi:YceD family protein [Roseivivax isoporae]|uniref:50S ribosomal protein L34 n=1 Tax=Roseivivax isoporae LMG 25204 TaxID=1449351 RepID=X7FF50_9RHOB|nr:DUF177 domain-containing protein [Roseivivax isoporae]ETX30644.1 hypothetical protein RISW2_07460 [Roseivivax isoporae LMG 25204]